MRYEDILHLPITEIEIFEAIKKAQQQLFIDNLRDRHPNVAFDSQLRGYVGEIGMRKWLLHHHIEIEAQNTWSEAAQMDVDFRCHNLSLELKTSLIPAADKDLKTSFERRDIKIIKRKMEVHQLRSDVHIQIYFDQSKQRKDHWLRQQKIDLKQTDLTYLYDAFAARSYLKRTYLVAWMDKKRLQEKLDLLPRKKQTWSYAKRDFWCCPLRESFAPNELIPFLHAQL